MRTTNWQAVYLGRCDASSSQLAFIEPEADLELADSSRRVRAGRARGGRLSPIRGHRDQSYGGPEPIPRICSIRVTSL